MKLFHDFISFFFPALLGLSVADAGAGNAAAAAPAAGAAGGEGTPAGGEPAGGTGGAPAAGAPAGPDLGFLDAPLPKGWAKAAGLPEAWESKFTTLKPALGSYAAAEKLVGAKGIIPLGPNATPAEKDAYYKALGRPDKPEEYGIKMPEKIGDKPFPKELWNADQAAAFAKWAHGKGWSKQQVQDAIEFDAIRGMTGHEQTAAAQAKARSEAETALKTEWGADYAKNLQLAQKAAKEAGGDELLGHPLANDPVFIRAMAKVGGMIVEMPAAGARGTSHAGTNPAAEIAAMMNDKKGPWQADFAKNGHSAQAHQEAVERMAALYRQKNGEAAE